MLVELNVKPGVYKNGSAREAKGRYYDANLVRWKNSKLKPIGGWAKTTSSAITGKGRTMLPFLDNDKSSYIAVGTSSKLYVYTGKTSAASDITPTDFVAGNDTSAVGVGFGSGPYNGTELLTSATYTASTISASTTDDSFNDSATGFDTTEFGVGDLIQVSGFTGGSAAANNKAYSTGTALTFTTEYALYNRLTTGSAHSLVVNDTVVLSGSDIPAPLVAGTVYHVKTQPTTTAVTLAATAGGTEITLTDNGIGTHTLIEQNSHRITGFGSIDATTKLTNKIIVAASNLTTDTNTDPAVDITISKARNFGEDEYAATTALVTSANLWSFDLWGQYLIACSDSDGKIYYWDPSATDPLETVAAEVNPTYAPTQNTCILVSKERHLIAFGADGNPKKIEWCTSEDYSTATGASVNAWYAAATNDAGSFEIDTTGKIRSATKVGNVILINTDVDCHEMRYVGPPYIYSRRLIASSCGIISRQAVASVAGFAVWMSYNGNFFMYDGSVRPLPCDVSKYIADDMNVVQDGLFYAVANSLNNEIWWFYVSSAGSDIDRYVIWNYAENWWSIGQLERTAFTDVGVFEKPLGIALNGHIYEHEKKRSGSVTRAADVSFEPTNTNQLSEGDRTLSFGLSSASTNEMTYAETGVFEVGIGDRFANVKTMITDTTAGDNALSFKVYSALNSDSTETVSDSYALGTDGYTHLRETGRQLRLKILAPFDQDFEISALRAQVSAGGRR